MPSRARHDFEADIHFLSPEEGGRSQAPIQGYRPDIRYPDDPPDQLWMVWPVFITETGEEVAPGVPISNPTRAQMWVVSDEMRQAVHRSRVRPGLRFYVQEGPHVVAEGTVTQTVGLFDEGDMA